MLSRILILILKVVSVHLKNTEDDKEEMMGHNTDI